MVSFDFITQKELRAALEDDYKEITACIAAGSWKAVHVLAGSVIEALLVDQLITSDYQKRTTHDPLKMALAELITACKKEKVISQKTAELCNVVKHYRNLIHPGRTLRLKEKVNEPGAKIAHALVEIVVKEISTVRRKIFGYTAEQIISKIERDISAVAILRHIIAGVGQVELERLLLEVLPKKYLDTAFLGHFQDNEPLLQALETCFRSIFTTVSDEVKATVAKRFVTIVKEEDGFNVRSYGDGLFRAADLRYLSDEDALIIKEHLLSRLKEEITVTQIKMLNELGRYLTVQDINKFIDPLVRAAVTEEPHTLTNEIKIFIDKEFSWMPSSVQQKTESRLNEWVHHFERGNRPASAQILRELIEGLIPF
ncbi:MAG: hypothetical protein JNM09_30365 [Blastocatellia bacterium]|nr:hypothetical protein [Blastocatellia bacterium]